MEATAIKKSTSFPLSDQQQHVVNSTVDHILSGGQEMTIGGLAGTGKSTIASHIYNKLVDNGKRVVTLCPTGKAANVLRTKGIEADTIHSAIYNYGGKYKEKDEEYMVWHDKDSINGEPDVMMIDESSMVNGKLARDLREFRKPIIWVGDYGQLPPVGQDPKIMAHPDHVLTENFRVGKGNDIVDFALSIRNGELLENCNDAVIIRGLKVAGLIDEDYDQVITGFNSTRVSYNRMYRKSRGIKGRIQEGEKLICVHNNRRLGIFNGMQLIVKKIHQLGDLFNVTVSFFDDPGQERVVNLLPECLGQKKYNSDVMKGIPQALMCDYGYAITCHKSQGSEWENVLVVNEACQAWDQARWLYTGATRASKFLNVLV